MYFLVAHRKQAKPSTQKEAPIACDSYVGECDSLCIYIFVEFIRWIAIRVEFDFIIFSQIIIQVY